MTENIREVHIKTSIQKQFGFVDINSELCIIIDRREACFPSGLTLKSDMLVNHVVDRWRTTLKSDILTGLFRSLADNTKISHKERVCSTVVLLPSLSFMTTEFL